MTTTKNPIKSIVVKVVSQYGQKVIVPVCMSAITFADIAGTKTLTKESIKLIQSLGYAVNVKQEIVTLNDFMAESV